MNERDGGPAFPTEGEMRPHGGTGRPISALKMSGGMSLRDYFAGQALAGLMATVDSIDPSKVDHRTAGILAGVAYETADAMLAARSEE